MQRELGRETENMQRELNSIAANEAAQQADLDAFINELQLSKAQQIMADAAALRDFQGF
jgi:cell division FtsZ-interacting protein ZapD